MGAFVRHQAAELTRLWRIARSSERPDVFPGLLDGVVQPFLDAAGELLERGGAPQDAIQRARGVVRWPPAIAPAELGAEWAVLRDVVATASESVNCDPPAAEWLARAVDAASEATAAMDGGRGPVPAGVAVVLVLSSVAPVSRPER
jgi:hypothetical protein